MPAEGERLFRRLGRRDRFFIGMVAVLLVAGIVVALLVGNGTQSNAGCVIYSRAGFTGNETSRYCGTEARSFCRGASALGAGVVAQCGRLGLPAGPRPAGDGG
jgi:hypothetical protein